MEFVGSIVTPTVDHAIAPVGRQCGYMIFHKSNLHSLRDQRDKLEERIGAIQQSIEVAERNLEVIKPDVEGWMKRAEKCSKDAKCILDQYDNEASKWCLKWCPNIKSRYSLSREATKKAKEVAEIRNEGNFNRVSNPAPPPPIESTISTEGLKGFESRGRVINEIMKVLKDENENMIGICGMGGVGKTTMAKEIIRKVQQEKLFDHVVMATISKPPDMRKIQGEIADCLGMKLDAESTSGRARKLFEKIEGARTFVVLDDVWDRLELSDIGIPNREDYKDCKILLTSRNEEVVAGMGGKIFKAEVLTKEEAWSLFKEKAGILHDEIGVSPYFLSKQKEVAEECGGLPLAIVCVAAALKGKEEPLWGYACSQLRQSIVTNIGKEAKKVYVSLEFSYNQLVSEEAKKCFLLCSMYPEDSYILVEDLVWYGFALKLFEGTMKVAEAREATYYMVDTLKKCYLLMDSDREEHVKMHDVIRDMAISIATKKEDPFLMRCDLTSGHQLNKDKHKNYPIISVECLSRNNLPSNLELPKLSLFRLVSYGYGYSFLEIPDSFYRGMQNLKVLHLCNIIIYSFPTLLGCLSELHTLSLNGCIVCGNMSVIGKMKSLEILSFRKSTLEELPIEMGQLTQLKLLDLYSCGIKRISPGVLSSLSNLEELYVGKVFRALLEHITELFSLSNLMALDISLKYIELSSMNWTPKRMKNFHIQMGPNVPFRLSKENYMLPNTLYVEGIDVPNIMKSGLGVLLKISKQLWLTSIPGLNNDFGKESFECLTQLELRNCENIEYLMNETSENLGRPFPLLKSLTLSSLQNFKQIYQVQSQKGLFAEDKVALTNLEELVFSFMDNLMEIWPKAFQIPLKLGALRVEMCPLLNGVLLPSKWMQCGLKIIYIKDCPSVEVLFDLQEVGHPHSIVALPVLDELKILHLPKLVHVWKTNTTSPVNFQGFQNLKSIKIEGCNNLRNLFPTYVAKLLQNLDELIIKDCGAMGSIVADEPKIHDHDGEGTSSGILYLFPKLKILSLMFLPKLRILCPQGSTFAEECLQVKVWCCPNIMQHFYGSESDKEILPKSTDISLLNRKFIWFLEEEILVEGMDRDTWYEDVEVQTYLHNARKIHFLSCEKLLSIASSNLMGRLHNLQVMLAGWCDSVHTIFDFEGLDYEELSVSLLNELHLRFLPKLIHIWKIAPRQSQFYFSQLRELKVESCDSLRYIFTISMAKALVKLRILEIKCCGNVEKIVATCDGGEDEKPWLFFSANCSIKLEYLPNLICFGPEEDCTKYLITENLDIAIIFCRKYKGLGRYR